MGGGDSGTGKNLIEGSRVGLLLEQRGVTPLEFLAEAGVLAVRLEPAPQRVERQRPAPPDPAAGDM